MEAPTEVTVHQRFLVAGWLSGEEVSWEPVPGVEVTPAPVDPGLEVTPGPLTQTELDLFADEVLTYALPQVALGLSVDLSAMEGLSGQGERQMFGVGVLEWMGATGSWRMQSGAHYREMEHIVNQAERDKAANGSVDAQSYETTEEVGTQGWALRVARINGWLTAAGVLGSRPANGSRQALIDKARGLAAATGLTGTGSYDVPAIAREVFQVQRSTVHQVYVVGQWIGIARRPEAPRVVRERRPIVTGPGAAAAVLSPPGVSGADGYVGDTLPPVPGGNAAVSELVDYVVARAMHERLSGRPFDAPSIAKPISTDPYRAGKWFVIGVLDWFTGTEPFADGVTSEQMRDAVRQTEAVEGERREHYAAAVIARSTFTDGTRNPTSSEINRLKGWIAAAGLLSREVPHVVGEMKGRALALARHIRDIGGEPDV
ncbi:hypothetical protein, partial [Streptomyces wedmorensis]|uniref:hypothetical protein n=1 Tax=Streptomyces wedmorensis TaxID=43759 RepID=UPI0037B66FE6